VERFSDANLTAQTPAADESDANVGFWKRRLRLLADAAWTKFFEEGELYIGI